jgi:hypothetical protein
VVKELYEQAVNIVNQQEIAVNHVGELLDLHVVLMVACIHLHVK